MTRLERPVPRPAHAPLERWPVWSAPAAAAWSAAYAAAASFWSAGGAGFPFGVGDPEAGDMGSLFVGLTPGRLAPPLAALCVAAAALALTMRRAPAGRGIRRATLVGGWGMAALLLLIVPDVRLMRSFGYLVAGGAGFVDTFDWPVANQLLCAAGGALWAAATLAYHRRTAPARPGGGATPAARAAATAMWRRRARRFAAVSVLAALPYELTRWAWALGWPVGVTRGADVIERWPASERVGVFVVGAVPFLGGVLTHGLAAPWGERVPRRVPLLGGRPVPTRLVVATAGTAALLIITGASSLHRISLNVALGRVPEPRPDIAGWGAWAPGLLWLPWGLSLAGAVYCYRRRRAIAGDTSRR